MNTLRYSQVLALAVAVASLACPAAGQSYYTATHSCAGYTSPGTITIDCEFSSDDPTTLNEFMWYTTLPSGWTLTSVTGGGFNSWSVYDYAGTYYLIPMGITTQRPVRFSLTVSVPSGVTGTQSLTAGAVYWFADMGDSAEVAATPSSLDLAQASVGNFVWDDANRDGIQDAGETGLVGVAVSLYSLTSGGSVTNYLRSVATDASGAYQFADVADGTYLLRVDAPVGYTFAPRNVGADGSVDSDFGPTHPFSSSVTLAAGQAQSALDAGLYYEPTLAVITSFRAFARDGVVFVGWDVAAEFDTLGYRIERRVGAEWVSVNPDEPVWSELLPWGPFSYEVADPGAALGGTYTWQVVELEGSGRENTYGPYTVTVGGAPADYNRWSATTTWSGTSSGQRDDPDGDGLTNYQEFLAGTDPLNRNSTLKIMSLARLADGMEIRWPSAEGRVYAVLYVRNLGDEWLPVKSGIVATAPENRFVLPGADGGFFKIALEPAP